MPDPSGARVREMSEIPAALARAFRDLANAVEEHLSAYSDSDEMADSDQALADALACVKAASDQALADALACVKAAKR